MLSGKPTSNSECLIQVPALLPHPGTPADHDSQTWVPCQPREKLGLSSCLWSGPTLAVESIWRVRQNTCRNTYLVRDSDPECTKNIYKSIKTSNPNLKNGHKTWTDISPKSIYTNEQNIHGKTLRFFSHWESVNQTAMRSLFTPIRMFFIKKKINKKQSREGNDNNAVENL